MNLVNKILLEDKNSIFLPRRLDRPDLRNKEEQTLDLVNQKFKRYFKNKKINLQFSEVYDFTHGPYGAYLYIHIIERDYSNIDQETGNPRNKAITYHIILKNNKYRLTIRNYEAEEYSLDLNLSIPEAAEEIFRKNLKYFTYVN